MFAKAMNELDLDLEVFRYPAINKPAGVVHWVKHSKDAQNLVELNLTSRRDILLEYVKNVQPEFMELFFKRAPQQVAENLAQLMYSVLMTGYMFRNAQYPLELQQSLEQVALPDTSSQQQKDLTSSAGEDVVVAMNTFIKRLLAVSDPSQMKTSVTETSAPELAKLLYWLMVVGYSIRNIEVRFDMERVLGSPPKRQELPPAENI
ncbi:hypothetical protein L2E82_36376 [Cichorium intybus]|uniref:Uncharacterized protein n=1 Tax=Cichorium intybus TaxID=13427 RepID=A0ACB9BRI2_CICIN|nr:hypothetical protein L2E82_36376 [Cichorium intybus]